MTSHALPTLADLARLAAPTRFAVTVYAATSPVVAEREVAFTTVKSAVDTALARLREAGARHADEAGLREHAQAVLGDADLWGGLSASLAVFLTPTSHEVYVLPNALEDQLQVADWFDVGQLLRAVVGEQHAYAATVSADGWSLWEATPTRRAYELGVTDGPDDAADATNRSSIRGRQHRRRLVGDEGRKLLLDRYATLVAQAIDAELSGAEHPGDRPLFLFAAEPLLSMLAPAIASRPVVTVPGAADELRADEVDAVIRAALPGLTAERVSAQLERMGNDHPRGLVATDLAVIGRAVAMAAVDTLVFDFTVDVTGTWDAVSGELVRADDGYDLLSRLAVAVAATGGAVVPVRAGEVSGGVWNGTAVAHLRHPLG